MFVHVMCDRLSVTASGNSYHYGPLCYCMYSTCITTKVGRVHVPPIGVPLIRVPLLSLGYISLEQFEVSCQLPSP